MRGRSATCRAGSLVLLLACAGACAPADPTEQALEERSRWRVDLLGWAVGEAGAITVSTRVSGPTRTSIEQLTFRVVMLDAANEPIDSAWWTVDLRSIERGGPKDVLFRIPASGASVEGLTIERVLGPTPEERRFIRELNP